MSANQTPTRLVIGTRGSPLALAQAEMVRDQLAAAHPGLAPELAVIKTSGDRFLDRPLAEIGGKGLFTKEIEDEMLAGRVDIAVHSMKDVATALPPGLAIPCILPREEPWDVLLARDPKVREIKDLPDRAVVGTASLRRRAQLLVRRPDVQVVLLRGNVGTRMAKLEAGEMDATFLALAGLRRLGLGAVATNVLGEEEMLPAVAQGAIGIECRAGDAATAGLLAPLNHPETAIAITAERALLAALDGSCRMPIAALARLDGDGDLALHARVVAPDGSVSFETRRTGPEDEAEGIGGDAGADLRAQAGPAFFAALGEA